MLRKIRRRRAPAEERPAYDQPRHTCCNCGSNMYYCGTRSGTCGYCGSPYCSPTCYVEHIETLHPDHLDEVDDPHYYTNDA